MIIYLKKKRFSNIKNKYKNFNNFKMTNKKKNDNYHFLNINNSNKNKS